MRERYIGIENELKSFKNGKEVPFNNYYFDNLKNSFNKVYTKSSTSIRTDTGNGFYIDGNEAEILTPPISLNKGFSSRLTDSLVIGRNKLIESTPELTHTGYSMHWNLSKESKDKNLFYRGISIPFQLFTLTPISTGFNLRENGKGKRYEILGDSINNPDQINAAALLFGAYTLAIEDNPSFPWETPELPLQKRTPIFTGDGRYDFIKGNFGKHGKEMQVQQFLEGFYHWLEPTVKKLGTKKEINNLEEFVYGEKELEFDKFPSFAKLYDADKKKGGTFLPFQTNEYSTFLKKESVEKLPQEAKLLGDLVSIGSISSMDWNQVIITEGSPNERGGHGYPIRNIKKIEGIKEIYEYAQKINGSKDNFETALENTHVNSLDDFVLPKKINDDFNPKTPKILNILGKGVNNTGYFFKETGKNFRELWSDFWEKKGEEKIIGGLAVTSIIGLLGIGIGGMVYGSKLEKNTEKIIQEYKKSSKETPKDSIKINFLNEEIKNGE